MEAMPLHLCLRQDGIALSEARQLSVVLPSLDCVVCLMSGLPKGIMAEGTVEGSALPGVSG